MGSIAKSGTSSVVEVLSSAKRMAKHGMIYAAAPASDIICGPCQTASGIKKPYTEQYGLHNFMCIFNPASIT